MSEFKHQFSEDSVSVLSRETKWFQRGVAEAACIVSSGPTLNRDRGRHTLPAIYTRLVKSCDFGSRQGHMTQ